MACFHPITAFRTAAGEIVFAERGDIVKSLTLACGRCDGCKLERARQWSVRIMHEASLYEENCFVTLTYEDGFVPRLDSKWYVDFQLFMKRLRRRFSGRRVRFFACAEYGGDNGRPHFHVCLFNLNFSEDRKFWRKSDGGYNVYRSLTLECLWPQGFAEIGELSTESAGYVARYSLKKVTGDLADDYYAQIDVDSGEVTWRTPECVHMSLRPGIGADWFDRFHGDIYPHDRVVVRGVESRPPRYYDARLKKLNPDLLESLRESREVRAREKYPDNTDARLLVKEQVTRARVRRFKKGLR